jgi:hypothetical protein
MIKNCFLFISSLLLLCSCVKKIESNKVVICIPVYGQSLALGEEAQRVTDLDSLSNYANGRIVTESLNHDFGYFGNDNIKKNIKKLIGYKKRAFELSIYNMARILSDNTSQDTIICIFPGGQGATTIANLSKGSVPYQSFINNIASAHQESVSRGWSFYVTAICWMQGESDIVDYPETNYQVLIKKIWKDMNADILQITQQTDSIPFICYQANSLSRAEHFHANNYICKETEVPQTFVNLLNSDKWFWASGPTYPYSCVKEKIHINAWGQQQIGSLAAKSVLNILRRKERCKGLIPKTVSINGNNVCITLNIPSPPLIIDTIQVNKAKNYGFSVINDNNCNIIKSVYINNNGIIVECKESPRNCFVRYAVNGDYMKSGRLHGPRGNLRDTENNWCYQFNILCK